MAKTEIPFFHGVSDNLCRQQQRINQRSSFCWGLYVEQADSGSGASNGLHPGGGGSNGEGGGSSRAAGRTGRPSVLKDSIPAIVQPAGDDVCFEGGCPADGEKRRDPLITAPFFVNSLLLLLLLFLLVMVGGGGDGGGGVGGGDDCWWCWWCWWWWFCCCFRCLIAVLVVVIVVE